MADVDMRLYLGYRLQQIVVHNLQFVPIAFRKSSEIAAANALAHVIRPASATPIRIIPPQRQNSRKAASTFALSVRGLTAS